MTSAKKDTTDNDTDIEVLLRETFKEMDEDLKLWPLRIESDLDIKQLMRMWDCTESTARGRVSRLAYSRGEKWQWIKVRGDTSRGTMVLRRNKPKSSYKSREKQVVQRERSPREKTK